MKRLLAFLSVFVVVISETAGEMELSNITLIDSGIERNYTVTVHQANATEFRWLVNGTAFIRGFIETESGSPFMRPEDGLTLNDTLYGFTFAASGSSFTTTLSIKTEEGYGVVTFEIVNANVTFTVTSIIKGADVTTPSGVVTTVVSTSVQPTSKTGTTNPSDLATTESVGATTAGEGAVMPTASAAERALAPTTGGSVVLPNCDVGRPNCTEDIVFDCSREVTMEKCTVSYQCKNGSYTETNITCEGKRVCISPGVWGAKCDKLCGQGCPMFNNETAIHTCDVTTGQCMDNVTGTIIELGVCTSGWRGNLCDKPICQNCNGGVCLAPNFCGNCPRHFESGVTCRNISLDGFIKGSLPTLAILGAVVILLKLASDFYERTKKKSN